MLYLLRILVVVVVAVVFLLLRRQTKQHIKSTSSDSRPRPPTTPPTIMPTGVLLLMVVGAGAGALLLLPMLALVGVGGVGVDEDVDEVVRVAASRTNCGTSLMVIMVDWARQRYICLAGELVHRYVAQAPKLESWLSAPPHKLSPGRGAEEKGGGEGLCLPAPGPRADAAAAAGLKGLEIEAGGKEGGVGGRDTSNEAVAVGGARVARLARQGRGCGARSAVAHTRREPKKRLTRSRREPPARLVVLPRSHVFDDDDARFLCFRRSSTASYVPGAAVGLGVHPSAPYDAVWAAAPVSLAVPPTGSLPSSPAQTRGWPQAARTANAAERMWAGGKR